MPPPLFLHSFNSIDPRKKDFNLASKLSYFLWGSAPDQTLLSLAAQGTLSQKGNLDSSINRMLKDPKIERFLDSFPSQWMQLEALFSAQPDPKLYRKYSLDKKRPVSAHMVLEPLLLFDTVFIENRPLMELIKPSFSYQNDFLKKWYSLNDKTVDKVHLAKGDQKSIDARTKVREDIKAEIKKSQLNADQILKRYKLKMPKEKNIKKLVASLKELTKKEKNTIKKHLLLTKKIDKYPPFNEKMLKVDRLKRVDMKIIDSLKSNTFTRVPASDPRYGGIITNAAVLTMTSAPTRTQPITRGSWVIEVVLNDPPPPPPNDIPPLDEERLGKNMTIKESFAEHRKNPDCAGCHSKLDPLGFVLESFDAVGLWRDKYKNKLSVDPTGVLLKKYPYKNIVDFKDSLAQEKERFAKAFTRHLLRFALARKLTAKETLLIDDIAAKTKKDGYRIKSLIKEIISSDSFLAKN